ncbi:large conductance mechanosensitive channel protein MscL [Candidatus Woesearchaeota archaeon CG10_big_fil_rev_8_21_14_0_10_44_13]|nr:MAG: large conductance mechanosensitive channel protein MscL [Candidatus Woesearchaeota archaeon CG10_big_fil_rev_8_21_14_0_10_44_13]
MPNVNLKNIPHVRILAEFKEFLKEYKVVGLAVAFIMGAAATDLVKSLVNNVVMPLVTPFVPGAEWQTATLKLGPFVIGWGAFLAALINFIILAFVVFMVSKMVLKEAKVTKK